MQQPYGQPQYGVSYPPGNPYTQAAPPPYGAPGYGAPGYGAPGYGAPGYGAPMGAPVMGNPQYGAPMSNYPAPYPTGPNMNATGFGAPPPAQDMPHVMIMPIMQAPQQQELIIIKQEAPSSKYPSNANGVPHPAQIYCTTCQRNTTTVITDQVGSGTWTWCMILFCFTGLCCIPFCVSSCKDKIHNCPGCQNQVGVYEYKVC